MTYNGKVHSPSKLECSWMFIDRKRGLWFFKYKKSLFKIVNVVLFITAKDICV